MRILAPMTLSLALLACGGHTLGTATLPARPAPGMTDEPELAAQLMTAVRAAREGRVAAKVLYRKCVQKGWVVSVSAPRKGDWKGARERVLAHFKAATGTGPDQTIRKSGWSYLIHKSLVDSFLHRSSSGKFKSLVILPSYERIGDGDLEPMEAVAGEQRPDRLVVLSLEGQCPEMAE